MKEEYKDLFVSEDFDRKILVDAIKKYIKLTKEGKIVPTEDFDKLSLARKMLCILLARKILVDEEIEKDEKIHITELASNVGSKRPTIEGQIYGILKNIVSSKEGKTWVPSYNIQKAKKFLEAKNKKEEFKAGE